MFYSRLCLLLALIFTATCVFAAAPKPKLPTVAIVITGGTIVEQNNPKTGAATPVPLKKGFLNAVPCLAKEANIEVTQFSNIDSSHMTPQMWLSLSKTVNALLKKPSILGVVVVHGTDTMAQGAYFLDLTTHSQKPVVFTGAMHDASSAFPDGPENLCNAVLQASKPQPPHWGVTLTLNGYINSARDVFKQHTDNVQAFSSGDKGYLGYITGHHIYHYRDRLHRTYFAPPKTLLDVVLIKTYPGDQGKLIDAAVKNGAKGIVVEGFGAGNVNADVYHAIVSALKNKVVVVLTSQVPEGPVLPLYGDVGGGAMLKQAGVILANDLSGDKARLFLMLALADVGNHPHQLKQLFAQAI